jgi:hypothetical protein
MTDDDKLYCRTCPPSRPRGPSTLFSRERASLITSSSLRIRSRYEHDEAENCDLRGRRGSHPDGDARRSRDDVHRMRDKHAGRQAARGTQDLQHLVPRAFSRGVRRDTVEVALAQLGSASYDRDGVRALSRPAHSGQGGGLPATVRIRHVRVLEAPHHDQVRQPDDEAAVGIRPLAAVVALRRRPASRSAVSAAI